MATPAGRALCAAPFPEMVYHWHREGFQLPVGATLLAQGDENFPNQAFAFGAALGLQFHPEFTAQMIARLVEAARADLAAPGVQPGLLHMQERALHDGPTLAWLRKLLPAWLHGAALARTAAAA